MSRTVRNLKSSPRQPRPPVRRTGTRAGVIRVALVEYQDGSVQLNGRQPLVRTVSGSVELRGV